MCNPTRRQVQKIQIFDKSYQLLEQLENYNAWTATKFHYDQTRGLSNMCALMEGKSKVQGNFLTSLYWEGNAASKNNTYLPVGVVLPIHMSGILSGKKVCHDSFNMISLTVLFDFYC